MDDRFEAVLESYHDRMQRERTRPTPNGEGESADLNSRLLAVGPDTGRLINLIVRAMAKPVILEIGTSYGYSGLWLAEAARASGGRLITMEVDAAKSDYARAKLAEAGLADHVNLRVGDAVALIASAAERFDFVLLDLWKDLYVPCLEAFYPKLNPGSIVVADNMIRPGGPDADRYRRAVRAKPGLDSVTLPVGTGIEISRIETYENRPNSLVANSEEHDGVSNPSRRDLMMAGTALAGAATVAFGADPAGAADQNGFMAASSAMPGGPGPRAPRTPGFQDVYALCEVTGGGEKVYGIAVEYDVPISPASLAPDTYTASVFPAAHGFFPGMPQEPDKNAATDAATPRPIVAIYTNDRPALRPDRKSAVGPYVIAEFAHDPDLSLPTTDSDRVAIMQNKPVRTVAGVVYAAGGKVWSNAGRRGDNVAIRGVDAWEQNHWWWDDKVAATLEYSIYLPTSFLQPGGEAKAYPLVLAITHSGTSYDGTCAQTLTEQCIATIWSLPENQALHECVVITPRYERTTMNDYWEHTADVENTYRLVQSLLSNTWNYGNPNLADRRDKVLRIDSSRVYCTGWSMGAMTSLWLMAKHPDTFAAGLIIAGQQRPTDVVDLAKQKLLIITGTEDDKATPWNEKCVPVWEHAGGTVTRPAARLDPAGIFPLDRQQKLTSEVDGYLAKGGNITFLTFQGVDHMGSARKLFYIKAARNWLFSQIKS